MKNNASFFPVSDESLKRFTKLMLQDMKEVDILAAFIKRMGRKAIHIEGTLQLNFGIKGKRWEHYPLYNEFWITPYINEKPKNLENVEGGCYW